VKKVNNPKISVNKLGQYIKSTPHRRHEIVKHQKYPMPFITARYDEARKVIIDYFLNGKGCKAVISSKIKDLIVSNYSSNHKRHNNELSIQALEIFDPSKGPNLKKFNLVKFNSYFGKLSIEGVDVSIQPDIIINGMMHGKEFVGAIKLHFSKTNPLDPDAGKYVATMVHKFLEMKYPDTKVNCSFCISMDIFTGHYFVAPRSFKMLRKDITAACKEIKLLWESL
jgi:hypothetical protein